MPDECRSCHAPIDWATKWPEEFNEAGKPKVMPIDHDSVDDPKGKLEVWSELVFKSVDDVSVTVLRFAYLKQGSAPTEGHHRGVSHYATCPQAGQWRTRKPSAQASRSGWPDGSNGEAANR
jgi:hypothetical protein